ncbi:MAG: transglycosylase family protein [Actinomycetes bacterium]
MSEVRTSSLGAVRVTHGAVVLVAFVLVMAIAVVGVVSSAADATGEPSTSTVNVTMADHGDMYAAMADIALALEALPKPVAPPVRKGQTRAAVVVDPSDPGVWDELAHCETRGNWATDSAPGFAGGLGFANSTWTSMGGHEFAESAADATREQQIVIAQRVLESSGWGAWPGCSDLLGLR